MWKIPREVLERGMTREVQELTSQNFADPERLMARIEEIVATVQESFDLLELKDGRIFERYSKVLTIQGQNAGRVWSFRDVTERHLAEITSRRLAAIVASSDDAIIGKDLNSIIASWNVGAERIFGYTAGEMIGTSIMGLIPPDRQEEELEILSRIRRGERFDHFETIRLAKDGRQLNVSITVSPIKDSTGQVVGASKVIRDITERKKAEEALRASEERLQDIVDNTPAIIFVKDLELRFILVNREFERRHHVERDQIRGKTDFDILPHDVAEAVRDNDRQVIEAGVPIEFEQTVPSEDGERDYVVSKFLLHNHTEKAYAVCGVATDITELKRVGEMQAALACEREFFARQRAAELAKANEALRGCLDALASVPELDDFLGQVMAAITRHMDAVSSALRILDLEQNTLTLELLFQDSGVMSPAEAKYPEYWRSLSLDEERVATLLDQPTTVIHILDPHSPFAEAQRSYLLGLGIKTLLIIPLSSGGQVNGRLDFRFNEERDFSPEELEIARALATQASLAIQLTRLAKTATQSAVLEERNRLAGEIHDSLAQSFAGISMQLELAQEEMAAKEGAPLGYIRHAHETAKFGLAEARRSVLSLRSSVLRESGFFTVLQSLVERSNLAGRLRCDFRFNRIPEERLPATVQHQLLRVAQEAISNAVRHAKPTVVAVTLRWDPPNLILQVKDNGSGIPKAYLEQSEGVGLDSMRERAAQIDARLEIQTAAGRGTSIIVTVPISS